MTTSETLYIVAYYSRTTTVAMKKWSPYSLELSAITLTLKAFENVLGGLEIHIMSDNAVCVNINAFKPANNREKRLIAYLMGFDCTYHYVKGREIILADCLSRLSEDLDSDQISRFYPLKRPQKMTPFCLYSSVYRRKPKQTLKMSNLRLFPIPMFR